VDGHDGAAHQAELAGLADAGLAAEGVVRLVPLFQHCSRVHEEAILETTKRHGSISVIQHLHVVRALSCYIIYSFCWAGFKREILLRMLFFLKRK